MVPTQYFANLYDATYDKVLFYVLIKCGKEEVERLDFLSKDWEDRLVDCLTAQEVMKYISEKDELTKAIFYQHYFEEKTLKEIAESCGVKESTVKNRLYRTLRKLNG